MKRNDLLTNESEASCKMCFYDQHIFACGDHKWGHFRQHCNMEYRQGETCGMKLVMSTSNLSQKCRICDKIDTKQRRRASEKERINRWKKEGGKFRASIEKSEDMVRSLERELMDLTNERRRLLKKLS